MKKEYALLRGIEQYLLEEATLETVREIDQKIDWGEKHLCLFGERGLGKTTLFLQKRKHLPDAFYFSADQGVLQSIGLLPFVHYIVKNFPITTIFIDEIYRFPAWTTELKNLIDSFPQLSFRVTGSSSVSLYEGSIDLGRRMRTYAIKPLSFREYLTFFHGITLPAFSFSTLAKNHRSITTEYALAFSETHLEHYQRQGYYPFSKTLSWGGFSNRMNTILERSLSEDLLWLVNITSSSTHHLQKLFYFLAHTSPSEFSLESLSAKIGVNKDLLGKVISIFSSTGILESIAKEGNLSDQLRKRRKLFLGNPNLYAVQGADNNIGTLRESFALSSLRIAGIKPLYIEEGDYSFEEGGKRWAIEIGGKNKTAKQLKNQENALVFVDDFYGDDDRIPLWALGFLAPL